jgi:hypothetical protein
MILEVTLVRSGDGKEFFVGLAESLHRADELISLLDARYDTWFAAGCPNSWNYDHPLYAYEGCDIYATCGNQVWTLEEDGWEEL